MEFEFRMFIIEIRLTVPAQRTSKINSDGKNEVSRAVHGTPSPNNTALDFLDVAV